MPFVLRIEMLVLATVVLFTVFLAIRQRKLLVRFALIWLVIAVGMVFAALCPAFVIWLCGVVHIEQASNLIYLLGLLVLLFLSLGQTVLLSKQSDQIKRLTKFISLEQFRRMCEERDHGDR